MKATEQLVRASAGISVIQAAINTVEQASSEAGGLLDEAQQRIALSALRRINSDLLRKYDAALRKVRAALGGRADG